MKYYNSFAAFNSDDDEVEEGEITKRDELFMLGRAFWEEQQKGNVMSWGDWCDEENDDNGIQSGDECIVWKGAHGSNKNQSKSPNNVRENNN